MDWARWAPVIGRGLGLVLVVVGGIVVLVVRSRP